MGEVGIYAFKLEEMMDAAVVVAGFVGGALLLFYLMYLIKKTL